MAKSFDDLVRRTTTKKTQAKASRRAQELLGELLLSEVRQLAGKSQQEVAQTLGMKQPSLSKLEKQADMQAPIGNDGEDQRQPGGLSDSSGSDRAW